MEQEVLDHFQAPPSSLKALDLPLPKANISVLRARQNPSTTEIHKMELFWIMKPTLAELQKSGMKQMMDDTLLN